MHALYLTTLDRFMTKVEKTDGCWNWTGYIDPASGYGVSGVVPGTKSTPERAHRRAYRLMVGSLTEGLHLHHTCENKRCVNPDHLVPLEPRDHVRVHNPITNACKYGHPYPENLYVRRNGSRICRACDAERKRKARSNDDYRAYEQARARRRRRVIAVLAP